MNAPAPGKVYLIGGGPGAPDLITVRGVDRLGRADLVLYDYLVGADLLRHASDGAELICLGKHGGGRLMSQAEINQRMVDAARQGRAVARLKGGDPTVFGRAAEEIAALEAAAIQFEVVPGVTAATAAASCTGIPLTHREHASCVAFITGQECRDKAGESLDLAALAMFPGTLVFYMGVTTAPSWSKELINFGKSPDTPVAVVRHGSLSTQQCISTTLGQLGDVLAPGKLRPPAVILVGEAVAARSTVDWFASRPLFGRTVMVTRPETQATEMCAQLEELGARVIRQPTIEISAVSDWTDVDDAIAQIKDFDWVVFSSVNGVNYFLQRISELGRDLRILGGARVATIGPATAHLLTERGLKTDIQPREYRAEALAEVLRSDASGKRFLLIRASRGRESLAESLAAAGGTVRQVVVYQSRDVANPDEAVAKLLRSGQVDWTFATSSAIARSLVDLFGDELRKTKLAAISPLTAGILHEAGFNVAAVADEFTTQGLINAMLRAQNAQA